MPLIMHAKAPDHRLHTRSDGTSRLLPARTRPARLTTVESTERYA
jgi:hypothetical protein